MIDESLPLLVFGGPYSNLQATAAMQQVAQARGIPASNVICTGDVVAYAANPEETANLVRSWGIHVVAGNCEEQLASGAEDCGCGFEEGSACDLLSKGWYPYAKARVSEDTCRWMADMPASLDCRYGGLRIHVLHGGVAQNNRFLFASETAKLQAEAGAIDADVILAGHAGIPFVARLESLTWVNAGVIGVPANDGTTDGWYALLQPATGGGAQIALHRLAYDNITAAAAMRRSGHANGYARTLVTGIWPSHDVLPAVERDATGTPIAETTHTVKPSVAEVA